LFSPFADVSTFEYMRFAKSAGHGARIALTMSGMSPPPADWLGEPRDLMDLTDAGGAGSRFLRERIAARYGVEPDEVFVTPGASAAIHLVAGILCAPGLRAICERPAYPPLWLEPERFGARVEFVDRRLEEGFRWDPKRAAAALGAKPDASLVFITNLHNPSGTAIAENDLVATGEAAARAGARLVACELYGDFLAAKRPRPVATLVTGAVSIGSLTKAFGLGALRIGWVLCRDREVIRRLELLFDHIDVNCPMPSLRAAAAALERIERFERRALDTAAAGYAEFLAWARREASAGRLVFAEPAGGIVAFPRLVGVADTLAFAKRVRERHGVQLTPGEYFGAPGHLRIGFGLEPRLVREGLQAVSAELPAN
jgi:aspartate/methionine/tyrosine aminotransferase